MLPLTLARLRPSSAYVGEKGEGGEAVMNKIRLGGGDPPTHRVPSILRVITISRCQVARQIVKDKRDKMVFVRLISVQASDWTSFPIGSLLRKNHFLLCIIVSPARKGEIVVIVADIMTVDYRTACPFIIAPSTRTGPSGGDLAELRKQLETGDEETRIGAMQEAIRLLSTTGTGVSNGGAGAGGNNGPSSLLMTIIRFVLPNQKCKLLKKLVLLFFELAPKTDAQGRLLSEMILLCNALRNDLQHPNEYVRGVTLRFLTRIGEAEILEPLIPSLRSCLVQIFSRA